MKKLNIFTPFLVLASTLAPITAHANPLLSGQPSPVADAASSLTSLPFMSMMASTQKVMHETLTHSLQSLKDGQSLSALWALLLVSFGYGVFHILAPGHGKMIVGSYFLGHHAKAREAIGAGFIMAVGHSLSAVMLVVTLNILLGLSQLNAIDKTTYVELIGYGLIFMIGLMLLKNVVSKTNTPACGCGCCGHNHVPASCEHTTHHTPAASHKFSLFAVTSLVPCTGSMIILLFTLAQNLLWAGLLSISVMALGMWISVTLIGFVAIYLRRTISNGSDNAAALSPLRRNLLRLLNLIAALVVTATGGLLFTGALASL